MRRIYNDIKPLEQRLGLKKVSTKAHAMKRREAPRLDRGNMIGRGIAFGLGESVAGIFRIVFDHQLISRDLGNDRGGSDTCNGGIAVNNVAFAGDGAQRLKKIQTFQMLLT